MIAISLKTIMLYGFVPGVCAGHIHLPTLRHSCNGAAASATAGMNSTAKIEPRTPRAAAKPILFG